MQTLEQFTKNDVKEKEIILLKSVANTGKTTSINLLYNEVIIHYGLPQTQRTVINDSPFSVLQVNGKSIAFASGGDTPNQVIQNCDYFKSNNFPDICVTATRTKGAGLGHLLNFAKSNQYNISIHDFISWNNNITKANYEKVRMMLDRVKYLI